MCRLAIFCLTSSFIIESAALAPDLSAINQVAVNKCMVLLYSIKICVLMAKSMYCCTKNSAQVHAPRLLEDPVQPHQNRLDSQHSYWFRTFSICSRLTFLSAKQSKYAFTKQL